MLGLRWQQKPPPGTPIDWSHPFAEGLQVWLPLNEGTGGIATDNVSGTQIAASGYSTTNPWSVGIGGGLSGVVSKANGQVMQGTINAQLLKQFAAFPATIICSCQSLGAVSGGANTYIAGFGSTAGSSNLFGVWITTAGLIRINSTGNVAQSTFTLPTSTPTVVAGTVTSAATNCYINGYLNGTSAVANTIGLTSASLLYVGTLSGSAHTANVIVNWVAIYNRLLDPTLIADISASPNAIFQMYRPRLSVFSFAGAYGIAFNPAYVFANTSAGQVVTLTGTNTAWSGGTTFTVSGVSGTTKTAQSVSSATSATITLTTGSGTGNLAVSDGTYSRNLPVVNGTITISPTIAYGDQSSNIVLTLAGFGTTWGGGTTFTVSGVTGVSKVSQSVTNATSATVTISTTSSSTNAGTLSVSDGTYIGTTSVVVPYLTVSPAAIPANHAGNITLTLTGFGTNWSSQTFSVSGVTGAAKVSQTINSATSTTLVVTTGSGTGTLTISDGTFTGTVPVNAATFTLSPTSVTYGVPTFITATGNTGSLWTHETATTLFSTPGTHGDTISSITVISDTSATFTLTPGTTTNSLTVTQGPTGTTASETINGVAGSLRILNSWNIQTASDTAVNNKGTVSASFFVRFDTLPSVLTGTYVAGNGTTNKWLGGNGGNAVVVYVNGNGVALTTFPGIVYHVVATWSQSNSRYRVYVNGVQVNQATASGNFGTTWTGPWEIGFTGASGIDYRISNFAIWNSYELTATDVKNLRNGTANPLSISTPAARWWPLALQTSGTPTGSEAGFTDVCGSGINFATITGTSSNASFAAPITYAPPTKISPYVTKSGQLVCFMAQANAALPIAVTGTVSVNSGSATLTTSSPQSNWVGNQIQISGDSSLTTYSIVAGYANTFTISPVYGSAMNAVNASATFTAHYPAVPITQFVASPTVSVQFGGSGSTYSVATWGPVWTPASSVANSSGTISGLPCAFYQLLCGPVQSIKMLTGGVGYTSAPTASASGGGGSGLTLGTPLITGGVTSISVGAAGSGYSSPVVTVAAPSIALTGTLTSGATTCTGLSSTAGLHPGMSITGTGNDPNAIAAIVSTTAVTLGLPAGVSGSQSLTFVGRTALAKATLAGSAVTGFTNLSGGSGYGSTPTVTILGSGGATATATVTGGVVTAINLGVGGSGYLVAPAVVISGGSPTTAATVTATINTTSGVASVAVFDPGSGYGSTPTVTITPASGTSGSGATASAAVTNIVQSIPVTAAGSNYTSAPTISITGGGGSGATAAPIMAGVGSTDVVTYAAASEGWLTTTAGLADAVPSTFTPSGAVANYSGQLEPGFGGFLGPNLASNQKTLQTGFNCSASVTNTSPFWPLLNWFKHGFGASNVATYGFDRRPLTITATAGTPTAMGFANPNANSGSDSKQLPVPVGTWTFVYDDLNGSSPLSWSMTGLGANVSSPTFTEGTSATGVNAITLVSGGSGYGDIPTVSITGGGGSGATAYALMSNGAVIQVSMISPGSGYTSAPTVTFTDPAGTGSGASATTTTGTVLIGRTFQWTVSRATVSPNLNLVLNCWTNAGGTYPYTGSNEFIFDPLTTAAAAPAIPTRSYTANVGQGMRVAVSTASGKGPAILRFMDSTQGSGGVSNLVDPEDMLSSLQWDLLYTGTATVGTGALTPTQAAAAPTRSRNFTVNTVRTYATSSTPLGTITVTSGGSGYSGQLPVSITGGGGTGATGYATVTNGVVASVVVTAAGSGYTSAPQAYVTSITFLGIAGTGAVLAPTISGGSVTGVAVTSGGSIYHSSLPLSVSDASGTGAIASGIVSGYTAVTSVAVTSGGSGYTSAPTVTFSAPGVGSGNGNGTTATGTATISGGAVTGVTITNGGTGYGGAPTIGFSGGGGTGAAATATVSYGSIGTTSITNGGANYASPTVTLSGGGGTGATFTATSGWPSGCVSGVQMTTGGSGYTSPVVTFSAPASGVTATGTAIIGGGIASVTVTNGGSGYTSAPTVTFSQPSAGQSGSTATAVLGTGGTAGQVVSITITNPGCNYTANPTVTISAPTSGTTATANATYSASSIVGINLSNLGSGYGSTAPTVTITDGGSGSGATATAFLWNVTWSSPNLYTCFNGTANPSWTGYGTGYQGGPYYTPQGTPNWLNYSGAPTQSCTMEWVATTPHNLKTGQLITISYVSGRFALSNGSTALCQYTAAVPGEVSFLGDFIVFVTGPTTFVITQTPHTAAFTTGATPSATSGLQLPGGLNTVAGSFPVNYLCTVISPEFSTGYGLLPYESAAQVVAGFPGCHMHVNVPMAMSDAGVKAIARRVRDNLPAGRKVHVEYSNECWNSGFYSLTCIKYLSNAGVFKGGTNSTQGYVTRANQIHNLFIAIFNQTDVNGISNRGGEIVRLMGSWYGVPATTQTIVAWANQNGIPFDEICVADYLACYQDMLIPTTSPTVSVTGGGSTGGSLPAGSYYVYYTWVDAASGLETSLSPASSVFTVASGNIPQVTIPTTYTSASLTVTASSVASVTTNIYLTATNAAAGAPTLFASGITGTTTNLNAATWSSTAAPSANLVPSIPLAGALLAPGWPTSAGYKAKNPWSRAAYVDTFRHSTIYSNANTTYMSQHQAALNQYVVTSTIPGIIGYEGGDQNYFSNVGGLSTNDPSGFNLNDELCHDIFYEPSTYDNQTAFFVSQQQWGYKYVNVFHLCGSFYLGTSIWPTQVWTGQPVGKGDGSTASDGVARTNLFYTDTGSSHHEVNTAVRLKGQQDWADISNPTPTTLAYTLTGATSGVAGIPITLTLTPNGTIPSDSLSFSDNGASGVFSVSHLTWSTSSAAKTLTYTPAITGTIRIDITSGYGYSISGSPLFQVISSGTAGYVVSGPSSGESGVVSASFTVSPVATIGSDTVTLSDGGHGGAFSPTSLTFSSSATPQTFTYTPAITGTIPILVVSSHSYTITGSPLSYLSTASLATLTGPSSGGVGINSTNFNVALNGPYSGVITPSDSSAGGTFTPTYLTGNGTFVYVPAVLGPISISITASPAISYSGSPATYNVVPTVSSTNPAVRQTSVSATSTVTATFSAAMDSASITTSTFTLKQGASTISSTVSYNPVSQVATLTPNASLSAGATYTATITTGATASGYALAAPYSWTFTVAGGTSTVRWFAGLRRRPSGKL